MKEPLDTQPLFAVQISHWAVGLGVGYAVVAQS